LEQLFADRLVPLDLETASIWGEITARSQLSGVTLPAVDGLLAASALRNGLHLMTRNTRHFQATGVMLVNPWASEDS
jgi:predicted nucleic acid-binding protein